MKRAHPKSRSGHQLSHLVIPRHLSSGVAFSAPDTVTFPLAGWSPDSTNLWSVMEIGECFLLHGDTWL